MHRVHVRVHLTRDVKVQEIEKLRKSLGCDYSSSDGPHGFFFGLRGSKRNVRWAWHTTTQENTLELFDNDLILQDVLHVKLASDSSIHFKLSSEIAENLITFIFYTVTERFTLEEIRKFLEETNKIWDTRSSVIYNRDIFLDTQAQVLQTDSSSDINDFYLFNREVDIDKWVQAYTYASEKQSDERLFMCWSCHLLCPANFFDIRGSDRSFYDQVAFMIESGTSYCCTSCQDKKCIRGYDLGDPKV
jgi:hypothetical protein